MTFNSYMTKLAGMSLVLVLPACTTYTGTTNEKGETEATTLYDVNMYKANQLVCDPFDEDRVTKLESGVRADLYYRGAGQARWYTVNEYITKGQKSESSLFFSSINVPTRLFSQGFPLESGGLVKTDTGQDLFEYFALHFKGKLRLGPEDEEGIYQLALLSDDGAIWSIKEASADGQMRTVVSNDGDHPTRFGCGAAVYFSKSDILDFELKYYQGPRHHISLIPMWRKVDSENAAQDSQCGQFGNEMYFDYNNNSAPKAAYNGLLARGWKPLSFENYLVSNETEYNPCTDIDPPVISGLQSSFDPDAGRFVTWTTNIPATSQVLYINKSTGAVFITESDNVLRTTHRVMLTGLIPPGTEFEIRAISVSGNMGRTVSDPITILAP